MKTPSPNDRPPFVQLLLKAVLWTPWGIFLTFLLLASWSAVLLLPIMAAAMFYTAQPLAGIAYLAGAAPAFFIARSLTKRLWDDPPSLL